MLMSPAFFTIASLMVGLLQTPPDPITAKKRVGAVLVVLGALFSTL
jgi:hypothetical protein